MTDQSSDAKAHARDEVTGLETTGHEWDGIRELNTPLPRWWLYIFYATIIGAVAYWVMYPAWPALPGFQGNTTGVLAQSDRADLDAEISRMRSERATAGQGLATMPAGQIIADSQLRQFALAMGESVFGDNCAQCHGAGGRGAKGYPTLADDVWLWGGTFDQIEFTIRHGIRSGVEGARTNTMPAFGRDGFLPADQIADLVDYVVSLSGGEADRVAVERAAPVFQANCASCHGADGRGDQAQGAPNLTDQEWIYGGARQDILLQINEARGGVMPAWGARLDAATIRALSIYVHSLSGGE
jgi:cytochrome c oxidase cbb3-type subunit III